MQLNDTKVITVLTQAGLTLNESDVYLYLLKNGASKGGDIIQSLGQDKSSCYRALKNLMAKNLVFKLGEERNLTFTANPPEYIGHMLEDRRKNIEAAQEGLSGLTQSLEDLMQRDYYQNNVTVLHGSDGFRQWNLSRLRPSVRVIREISNRTLLEKFFNGSPEYDQYMAYYIAKRKKQRIRIRVLINPETRNDYIDITSGRDLKETRILPTTFKLDAVISTWGIYTGFISQKRGDVLLLTIRDELISRMVTQMYDVIWGISRPKPDIDLKQIQEAVK